MVRRTTSSESPGAKPRHGDIKSIHVRSRVVNADVSVRKVLIAITDTDRLSWLSKYVDATAEVDGVHELRALRRKHFIREVNKPGIHAHKWLETM